MKALPGEKFGGKKVGGKWRLVVARLVVVVGGGCPVGCGGCGGCWLLVVGCWLWLLLLLLLLLLEKMKRTLFNMSSRPSRTKKEH